ncbi:anthranilate synthase component II [Corallincola platygyrae]|uniref:Anthranilate synthase component II n=1 Tax=Corallincola platygyrae TaxID=1193278 RepID=A0ABW4XQC5_9GAMM
MLLMIDNYDSFTYNLAHYFSMLGQEVEVVRNDEIDLVQIEQKSPDYLVISPGPSTPNEAGISLAAIEAFAGKIPILGVCLGHQAIGQVFGADVVLAKSVMHGKTSRLYHNGQGMFSALPSEFNVTRYHSLVLSLDTLPGCLEVTAWTSDESGKIDEVMGIKHRDLPIEGVQFHPESILSEQGHALLQGFLRRYQPRV